MISGLYDVLQRLPPLAAGEDVAALLAVAFVRKLGDIDGLDVLIDGLDMLLLTGDLGFEDVGDLVLDDLTLTRGDVLGETLGDTLVVGRRPHNLLRRAFCRVNSATYVLLRSFSDPSSSLRSAAPPSSHSHALQSRP